jgi:hypothetical protein
VGCSFVTFLVRAAPAAVESPAPESRAASAVEPVFGTP